MKEFEISLGFMEPKRSPLSFASLKNFKVFLSILFATSFNSNFI